MKERRGNDIREHDFDGHYFEEEINLRSLRMINSESSFAGFNFMKNLTKLATG